LSAFSASSAIARFSRIAGRATLIKRYDLIDTFRVHVINFNISSITGITALSASSARSAVSTYGTERRLAFAIVYAIIYVESGITAKVAVSTFSAVSALSAVSAASLDI
jgi:hypothetical protein